MKKLNNKIQIFIKQIIIFICFTTLVNPQLKASTNKENQTYEIIEKFTKKSSKTWSEDKLLKTIRLPQTILLDADSRIYFSGCFRRGEKLKTIEGSSYCDSSHTIYLTKEDIEYFYKLINSYGLIYLLGHEWSHALQHAYLSQLNYPAKELQADCLAGKHVSLFHSDLNKSSIFSLARLILYIGGPNHGSGSQRAFAMLTGAGIIDGNCEDESMKKLARNKKIAEKKIKKLMRDFDEKKNLFKK